jgi:hypothetical protein
MRRTVWIFAWILVAFWSMLAWALYGVISLLGGLLARGSDLVSRDPETVEWLFRALTWLKDLGLGVVAVVGGVVALAILGVAFVLSRLRPVRIDPAETQIVYPPGRDAIPFAMPRHEERGDR